MVGWHHRLYGHEFKQAPGPRNSPMGLAKGIAIMPAVLDTAWPQRRGAGSPYRLSLKENVVMWGSQVPGKGRVE